MRTSTDDIKKRLKQREDMFLWRLFGMIAKMAKADGSLMIFAYRWLIYSHTMLWTS